MLELDELSEYFDPREIVTPAADIHDVIRMCINMRENLFITGPAGTGKSYIIKEITKHTNKVIHVSASTGLAAMNVAGTTVHSLLGFRIANHPRQINSVISNWGFSSIAMNMDSADMIIIDEISMLKAGHMDLIDEILRFVAFNNTSTKSGAPFGATQIVLFGDLLQLPPVAKGNEDATNYLWPFESKVWGNANIRTIALSKIYRQQDPRFTQVLNKVRRGIVDMQVRELLVERSNAKVPKGIRPLRFAATNKEVAAGNTRELAKLPGKEVSFIGSVTSGDPTLGQVTSLKVSSQKIDHLTKFFDANSRMELELIIKVGAPIVMLTNRSAPTENYVNGSMGKFIGMSAEGLPRVELFGAEGKTYVCTVTQHIEHKHNSKGDVVASFKQIPMRLAYYTTYHKCQGMTLDYVELDMAKAWEYGQVYTGLSRVRTLNGLFIKNLRMNAIKAHPKALKFYGYIK